MIDPINHEAIELEEAAKRLSDTLNKNQLTLEESERVVEILRVKGFKGWILNIWYGYKLILLFILIIAGWLLTK